MMRRNNLIFTIFFLMVFASNLLAQPLAHGKDKFLGSCVRTVKQIFTSYWNQVTPENAGKWGSVEGTQDQYNWTPLDNVYNFALTNNFPYKHHALVWGQQYPSWITSLDSANQRTQVQEWIQLVGQRYPDMDFIDVVNEPFHAPPPFANAIGGSGTTGWDWVVTSFEWARQYCAPGVKLILNEYNILHDNGATTNYLKLIDTLKVRGLIDGIGVQGHYFEFKGSGYTWPIANIQNNLNRLVATGLPFYITEFDINEANDNVQLQNYQTYFPIFWENPGVKGITLWGYLQYEIWKTDAYLLTDRYVERPALQWLRTYIASPVRPLLISPLGTTGEVRNPVLMWHSSDSATTYNVQVSSSSVFVGPVVDTIITDTSLQLDPLEAYTKYWWRVSASNSHGTSFFAVSDFTTGDQIVSVNESEYVPYEFELLQNYPNPFNPATNISFSLPRMSYIKMILTDILGKEILTIASGVFGPGKHSILFDAASLPSGIYFYRLETDDFIAAKKLIFMK